MISQDKKEKDRSDAKNAVEEYVYDMRGRLDGGEYEKYSDDKTRDKFLSNLRITEDWLYDEGAHQEKSVYLDRLKILKVIKIANKYGIMGALGEMRTSSCPSNISINSLPDWMRNISSQNFHERNKQMRFRSSNFLKHENQILFNSIHWNIFKQ